MTAIEKIQLINNISAIILVMLSITASTSSLLETRKKVARIFAVIIFINLGIDMIEFVVVKNHVPNTRELVLALNTINLIFRMITTSLLTFFKYKLDGYSFAKSRLREYLIMATPVYVGTAFLIANIFTGIVFTVNNRGIYTNSNGTFIINGIMILYFFATIVISTLQKNIVGKQPFVPMYIIAIPVIVGIILREVLLSQVSIGILGASVSLLIFVLSMSNAGVLYDPLTRVFNKEYFSYLMDWGVKNKYARVAGIMIDINDLKKINDQYGHSAGDDVILRTTELIKGMGLKDSALIRYGGDEFILLVQISDVEMIRDIMLNIKEKLMSHEMNKDTPYKLSLSMGMTVYIPGENINSFIRRMDEQMYFEKKAYHKMATE